MSRFVFTALLCSCIIACSGTVEQSSQPSEQPATEPGVEEAVDRPFLRLLFAGDLHFDWGVLDVQSEGDIVTPVEDVLPFFRDADFRFVNLETTITSDGDALSTKSYIFRADPYQLQVLEHLGVDVALLGNNHSMDLGTEGMETTRDLLRGRRIGSVGAGRNVAEASSPLYFRSGDCTFALLSYSAIGEAAIFASANRPGVAAPSAQAVRAAISSARRNAAIVIVSVHWGHEYFARPTADQVRLARLMIDSGAHLIVGHHPHVPQAVEVYKGGVIAYSLGNFLFGSVNEQQDHNLLLSIDVDREKHTIQRVHLLPIFGRYRDGRNAVRPLKAEESREFWPYFYAQMMDQSETTAELLRISGNGIGRIELAGED